MCARPPPVPLNNSMPNRPFSPQLTPAPAAIAGDGDLGRYLQELQAKIGYSFQNLSLLKDALTHSSYSNNPSYQRLEFVGDAVLNLAFTNFVFLSNPSVGPGILSHLRSANISTEKLARVAIRHDFYSYVRRNSQELDLMVKEFAEAVSKERKDFGEVSYGGSTVKAPKVLADIVESIAAAIYVDLNFDLLEFWKVFRGMLEPIITAETPNQQPVTHLYELCQKQGRRLVFENSKNDNKITTSVYINGELCGVGSSEQKYIAKLNAARDTLQKLCSEEENHKEVVKCSPSTSGTGEVLTGSTHINGEIGINGKGQENGDKEDDGSKQRFHLHLKNSGQKPGYRKHGRSVGRSWPSSLKVKKGKGKGGGHRGGRGAAAVHFKGGRDSCRNGRGRRKRNRGSKAGRGSTSSMKVTGVD